MVSSPTPRRNPAINLRDYDPRDFESLHALDQKCYPRGIAYSKRTLHWFLNLPGALCLAAEAGSGRSAADGSIAGFIIGEFSGARGHIITLDVMESYRRLHIGTMLLNELEARLWRRGVREVELETANTNEPGIAFWHRRGYRTNGVIRRYYLGRIDAYHMEKSLAAPVPLDDIH